METRGHILYLSYDGLSDHLGRSQVLPYLEGAVNQGFEVSVISADKAEPFKLIGEKLRESLPTGLTWESVKYHKFPPLISTLLDLRQMRKLAERRIIEHGVDLIHCRSYPAMEVGLPLSKKYGLPLVFDMRGFYPEERIDGGIWKQNNPIHRIAFQALKKKERQFVSHASHIVSLTEKAKSLMTSSFEGLDPIKSR